MSVRVCPHPEKRWYATKSRAKLALRRQHSSIDSRDTIHAYRCLCGGFHLGHKLGYRGHKLRVAA